MSDIDRRVYLPERVPFLEWFDGIYNSVFVALHPFVAVPGNTSAPVYLPVEDGGYDVVLRQAEVLRIDGLAKSFGVAIPWSEIQEQCCLSLGEIYQAVWEEVIPSDEPSIVNAAKVLHEYCHKNRLFFPCESSFPAIAENRICDLLERLHIRELTLSDEFIIDTMVAKLTELRTNSPWSIVFPENLMLRKIFSLDNSILIAVPFDGLYTAICGDRAALSAARVEDLFEGFWCDDSMTDEWWL